MGKSQDIVWEHWKIEANNKISCMYCKNTPKERHTTRCKTHTSACSGASLEVRKKFQNFLFDKKLKSAAIQNQKLEAQTGILSPFESADAVP